MTTPETEDDMRLIVTSCDCARPANDPTIPHRSWCKCVRAASVTPDPTWRVLGEIREERARQDAKWGPHHHPDGTGPSLILRDLPVYQDAARADHLAEWARRRCKNGPNEGGDTYERVLTEEWGEAISEESPARLRAELIQVAAVAARWVEAIDSRPTIEEGRPDA